MMRILTSAILLLAAVLVGGLAPGCGSDEPEAPLASGGTKTKRFVERNDVEEASPVEAAAAATPSVDQASVDQAPEPPPDAEITMDPELAKPAPEAAAAAATAPPPTPLPAAPPAPPPALAAVYRSVQIRNGVLDHLFSLVANEGAAAGYTSEGVVFRLLVTGPDSAPLFRCRRAIGSHFLSLDAACEGHTVEQTLGRVKAEAGVGMRTLSRCRPGVGFDSLATLVLEECSRAGYVVDTTLGAVYAPN